MQHPERGGRSRIQRKCSLSVGLNYLRIIAIVDYELITCRLPRQLVGRISVGHARALTHYFHAGVSGSCANGAHMSREKTTPFRVRLVFTDKIVRCSSNWLIVIKSLAVIKMNKREQSFGKANVYWTQVTGIYERGESTSSPEVGRCSWQKVASRDSLERACTGRCFRRTMRNKISRLCRTSSRRITVREKASRFCGNLSFFFCFSSLLGNLSNDWQQC